jgi:hypothetical protein
VWSRADDHFGAGAFALSGAGARLTVAFAGAFFAGAGFFPRFRMSAMLLGFVGVAESGVAVGVASGCDSGRAPWFWALPLLLFWALPLPLP